MSNQNAIPFRPVRGTDEAIQRMSAENGYLYMATDTRKIYLGVEDDKKILMGQDVGIFYGTKEIPADESGKPLNPEVFFHLTEIKGNRLPLVNDLILNVDGCFYRVNTVLDTQNVKTERLTLQGTGGGGGSGPGGGTSTAFSISFSNPSLNYAFASESEEMNVGVIGYKENSGDNYLSSITFTIGTKEDVDNGNKEPFLTENSSPEKTLNFNVMHQINLAPYKHLFNATNTTVTVTIFDKYGERRREEIKVRLITIALTPTMSTLLPATTSELTFRVNLTGATAGVSDKKLVYTFFKEEDLEKSVLTLEYNLNLNDTDVITKNLNLATLEHGIYVLQVQASAKIAGTQNTIYSNIVTHKVGYFVETTSPLLMALAPAKTEQYTNIPVEYLYVTNESNKEYSLEIRINNIFYKTINIISNQADKYSFYFEEAETKRIQFTILETGVSSTIELTLSPYTGHLPIIDLNRDDLMLYLNPKGKTNNDADRNIWTDSKKGQLSANLTGLNYSQLDGWTVEASTGDSCLKLISGARLDMPTFKPFDADPVSGKNANGMTIELDFEVNGILDFSKTIMSCVSYDITGKTPVVGFELVGDRLKMYNNRLNGQMNSSGELNGTLTDQTIVEGKRIKISLVIQPNNGTIDFPMCYTYLNGKLSSATIYDKNDTFIDSSYPATLEIDSEYAQIKIYGIRFYSAALSEKVILNNYTAMLPTLEERQKAYDSNNVYVGDYINFDLVSAEDYDLQIPYMKLTGGQPSMRDAKKKCLWTVDSGEARLPTDKKDYRFVDIEVVYPKNDLFAGYEDYTYINQFENGKWIDENVGNKAINGGAVMYCQGTSSMEYPVKNLRLRWKQKDNYFPVRPDLSPVEIICMKADYMESSGSHNTGAANFIDDAYESVNMKTPGQEYGWDSDENAWKNGKRTVSCIKGHPCLIFYSPSGDPGTYEYIGKYNLNLDKATPEPFGFLHDEKTNFGYLKDEEGNLVLKDGEKQNSIFCYEFLDNAAYPVCNFLITSLADQNGVVPTTYDETWHNIFWHEKDKEYYPGWRMGFESRYPEDEADVDSAEAFFPLANWINDLHYLRKGLGKYEGQANETEALAKFKNEYWKYLDKDFLLTYYLITEALLMADSRVKNMMIATWGPEWRYLLKDGSIVKSRPSDASKIQESHFGYIFYPIFYDMDTMLGLNNEGRMKFKYYTEDTEEGVYNGANVLWHLVRDSLGTEIMIQYSVLEGGKLHAPYILPYFNNNQANMANEAFYNGDAAYKYITPAREGYEDLFNEQYIAPGAAPYLYALQGDRSLHRESFINNRMQYLRGKYSSAKFLAGDRIGYRWYTPSAQNADKKVADSATYVIPDGKFTFTGLKYGFAGVQLGENGVVHSHKFEPNTRHTFDLHSAEANGTEAFLLGVSTLSDIGDLSNKYLGKFVISSPNNRLERITLGNPHKLYYNPNWATAEAIQINSPYLEYFNLQNCATYAKEIDFTNNPVINTILMTGSSTSAITLPENGVLSELRLPDTLVALRIVGHPNLTAENFSMGTYDYDTSLEIKEQKIGAGNGKYVDNFFNLTSVYVTGTPIDTYAILKGAKKLDKYYLHNIDWNLTEIDEDQYCKRESTWSYLDEETGEMTTLGQKVPANKFYTLTVTADKKFVYDLYDGTTYPTGNAYLYEKMSMLDENSNIICIPMLEKLLTLNAKKDDAPHDEALSGKITINIPDVSVVELTIYDRYKDLYPNVTIEYGNNVDVEEASTIKFYPGTADKEHVEDIGGVTGLVPGHFTLTARDAHTLTELIGDYKPIKVQTISNTFTFTGEWIDWADNNKTSYYQALPGFPIPSGKEAFAFDRFKPYKDMDLVPVFRTNVREYVVTLYDYDGKTVLTRANIGYNSNIGDFFKTNYDASNPETKDYYHGFYNYREYTGTEPNNRWAFKGWQTKFEHQNQEPAASIPYLTKETVSSDIGYYAFYQEEDATKAVSMIAEADDFFQFKADSETYLGVKHNGVQISLRDEYRYLLKGKITLPNEVMYNGVLTPVISIGNFSTKDNTGNGSIAPTLFEEVYFANANNSNYLRVHDGAFQGNGIAQALKKVYLPASIVVIQPEAFHTCQSLEFVQLNDNIHTIGTLAFWMSKNLKGFGLDHLPEALTEVGTAAFYQSGSALMASKLPPQLTNIPSYAFSQCSNANIRDFGSWDYPITKMSPQILEKSGNNTVTDITIYCLNGVIEPNAFISYNTANPLVSLHIVSPSGNEDFSQWGLNIDLTTTTITQEKLGG